MFCDASRSQEFAEAVRAHYKAEGTGVETISSLSEQHIILQKSDIDQVSKSPNRMNNWKNTWDVEGMMTAEEVATSGIRGCCERCGATARILVIFCV